MWCEGKFSLVDMYHPMELKGTFTSCLILYKTTHKVQIKTKKQLSHSIPYKNRVQNDSKDHCLLFGRLIMIYLYSSTT